MQGRWVLRGCAALFVAGLVAWILWWIAPGSPAAEAPHTNHQIAVPGGILTFDFPTDYSGPNGHHELHGREARFYAQDVRGEWQEVAPTPDPADQAGGGIWANDMQGKPFGAEIRKGWLIEKLFGGDDIDVRVSVRVPAAEDLRGLVLRLTVTGNLSYPEKEWFSNTFEIRHAEFREEVLTRVATAAEAEAHRTFMLWRSVLGWFALAAMVLSPVAAFWALGLDD